MAQRLLILIILGATLGGCFFARAEPKPANIILSTYARCMMGHIEDTRWYTAYGDKAFPSGFKSPEKYTLYGLDNNTSEVKGAELNRQEYPCQSNYYVNFSPEVKGAYTAIGNHDWQPIRRKIESVDVNNKVYNKIVYDFLKQNGVSDPKPRILQIYKADIQGDGKDEVFISATYYAENKNTPKREIVPAYALKGDYSLILARMVIDEKPVNYIIAGKIHENNTERPAPYGTEPYEYYINSILDVNGDGAMEIVIDYSYSNGLGSFVSAMDNNQFTEKLKCGCNF
ncbi:MAG: hypothetical protein OEZ39_14800 [Gammaproteobacteria bacterium]|nr:hypothetical protein [Gammaproteobacteria bacterium]